MEKCQFARSTSGRLFEIVTDGSTVWVNADDGMSVGRFGRRGVDVHRDVAGQLETGEQCLACIHGLPHAEGWEMFRSAIAEHYGIAVPEDFRPRFAVLLPEG